MEEEAPVAEQQTSGYPSYVVTDEQKRRWVIAGKAAAKVAAENGGNDATVWLATRSLYNSDIPTGPDQVEI